MSALAELFEEMELRFTSGNDVEVERTRITRAEYALLKHAIMHPTNCPNCVTELDDGPKRASPFHGSSVCCGTCGAELTRRTGGGQMDPFKWILIEKN